MPILILACLKKYINQIKITRKNNTEISMKNIPVTIYYLFLDIYTIENLRNLCGLTLKSIPKKVLPEHSLALFLNVCMLFR